jgi:putative hemolysin
MWTFELIVIALMIAMNGVLAAYEIALASVSVGRLQKLASEQVGGAAAALRMKQKMEASLAVVQLGITLVGAIAAATGGAGAEESLQPILQRWGLPAGVSQFLAIALIVAPLTVVTIILGELAPKVFALRNKERVCLKLSPVMEWFSFGVWPAVWFLETVVMSIMNLLTRVRQLEGEAAEEAQLQELHGAAEVARMSRLIGRREHGIIVSASHMAATPLRQVMLPVEYMGMLIADASLSEALIIAHQQMHTRFPVTEEADNPQRIIGYVNFKDIVTALRVAPTNPSLRSLVRRLRSFDGEMPLSDCLEHLMRERTHIALVTENKGIVVGLITLEDIIEELVGEIYDEYDKLPSHLVPIGRGWIAGGFVSLSRLKETTGLQLKPLSEKPVYTINDWIVERLEHPPKGGDELADDNCRVVVRKTRHIHVHEAYVEAIESASTKTPQSAVTLP